MVLAALTMYQCCTAPLVTGRVTLDSTRCPLTSSTLPTRPLRWYRAFCSGIGEREGRHDLVVGVEQDVVEEDDVLLDRPSPEVREHDRVLGRRP